MVKPSRGMQPEGVDLNKSGRAPGRAFQDDSFRNYMARKIDLQRQQFGAKVPPPPLEASQRAGPSVSFVENRPKDLEEVELRHRKKRRKINMMGIMERLKRRHGSPKKVASMGEGTSNILSAKQPPAISDNYLTQLPALEDDVDHEVSGQPVEEDEAEQPVTADSAKEPSRSDGATTSSSKAKRRADLFFTGIIVIINGYTHPDAESLQRLLQQHGGDVERYETTRVTHVIAEHLSTAKAKLYAKQRKPLPVVFPSWIMDCIKAQRILPHAPYLIPEVRDLNQQPSVTSFFQKAPLPLVAAEKETPPLECEESSNDTGKRVHTYVSDGVCHEKNGTDETPNGDTATSIARANTSEGRQDIYNPYSHGNQKFVPDEVTRMTDGIATPKKPSAKQQSPIVEQQSSPSKGCTDERYINGKIRTVGTDPNFLETFFAESRLSFIGSFRQRTCGASTSVASTNAKSRDRPSHRYILHIDMDSFFASVVLRNYPQYWDKPVAICHFGKEGPDGAESAGKESTSECATISYKAREFGIKKGMYLGRARSLCPGLIVLPYDFQGYEEVSEQVSEICHRYAAEHFGVVEPVSCDESYMEVYADNVELVGQLAKDIRQDIYETTRCTATVGVARNKFLAKLATDRVKPNGWYVASDYVELLRGLSLRDLHGIGYRSEPKLLERGFETVQDVWNRGDEAEHDLQSILGKQLGTKIYNFCKGIDDRAVQAAERKTIGAECNYGVRFDGPYGVEYLIEGLCKEVQKRMEHVGVSGAKVTLKVKKKKEGAPPPPKFLGHGSCHNLSKGIDSSRPTRDWNDMARLCKKMFDEMKIPTEDVRGMGVVVSKLQVGDKEPTGGIKSFFQTRQELKDRNLAEENRDKNVQPDHKNGRHANQEADQTQNGIDIIESDNEEEAVLGGLAQDYDDDENREVMMLTQLSASSDEVEDSGRERNRQSIDSMPDTEFLSARDGGDSDRKNDRRSIESMDLAIGNSGRKASRPPVEALDLASEDSRTKRTRNEVDASDDFEIPALSQLAMSQVGFLPTPMRRTIHARIQEQHVTTEHATTTENRPVRNAPATGTKAVSATLRQINLPRFLQTDVGRMMRLAAVKAGQGNVEEQAAMSFTQLERLPLEIQLQVANKDTLSLGKHFSSVRKASNRSGTSNSRERAKPDWNRRPPSKGSEPNPSRLGANKNAPPKTAARDPRNPEPVDLFQPLLDEREFFRENILPLSTFLDEHDATDESLSMVKDFVRQFMDDHSWHEVVLLLRSIRNRGDSWSKDEQFQCIYVGVNAKFNKETGDDLDFD